MGQQQLRLRPETFAERAAAAVPSDPAALVRKRKLFKGSWVADTKRSRAFKYTFRVLQLSAVSPVEESNCRLRRHPPSRVVRLVV